MSDFHLIHCAQVWSQMILPSEPDLKQPLAASTSAEQNQSIAILTYAHNPIFNYYTLNDRYLQFGILQMGMYAVNEMESNLIKVCYRPTKHS